MPFDASRDITILVARSGGGRVTLRTKGLARRRRPELEAAGVPQSARNVAEELLRRFAELTVTRELEGGERGLKKLAADPRGGGVGLLIAVRMVAAVPPAEGLWVNVWGRRKGVLRLADMTGPDDAPPLTALATLLARQADRLASEGNVEGARAVLRRSLALFPGETSAGPAPPFDPMDELFNWRNCVAHWMLAHLTDGEEGLGHYREALLRSEAIARAEIGAATGDLERFGEDELAREARRIARHNLEHPGIVQEPGSAALGFASPVWTPTREGESARRLAGLPPPFLCHYFEGEVGERLRGSDEMQRLAAGALARWRQEPWRAGWICREVKELYGGAESRVAEVVGPLSPAHALLSALLADAARCLRAGADAEEIRARFGLRDEPAPAASVETKLERLRGEERALR